MILGCDLLLVLFERHQVLKRRSGLDLDSRHPTFAIGVVGNLRGVVNQFLIYRRYFAVNRRIQIANGFYGFNLAEGAAAVALRLERLLDLLGGEEALAETRRSLLASCAKVRLFES
jgi:hypothetical protein